MFYVASKIVWLLAVPSNLLVGLVLLGLAASAWRRARRLGLAVAALAGCLLLACGVGPVGSWLLLPLEDRFPIFVEDGRPIDGVIVLGGATESTVTLARGQMNFDGAGERLVALADLARRLPAATPIVFSGGSGELVIDEPPEADLIERFGGVLGLDTSRILYERTSRTTWENATHTKALLGPRASGRWLLVTSAWHMPRSIGCFRRAGFDVTAYPVDYRTTGEGDLWRGRTSASSGLFRVDLSAKEWVGLLAYYLSGRIETPFPRP